MGAQLRARSGAAVTSHPSVGAAPRAGPQAF